MRHICANSCEEIATIFIYRYQIHDVEIGHPGQYFGVCADCLKRVEYVRDIRISQAEYETAKVIAS